MAIYKKHIKPLYSTLICIIGALGFYSCTDDNLDLKSTSKEPEIGEDMVLLPLNITFDGASSTKATGDMVNGEYSEHAIDFTVENECYALFFRGNNQLAYLKPLFFSDQIETPTSTGSEYTVCAYSIVNKDDVEGGTNSHLSKVLVVLNGGPIYENVIKKRADELLSSHSTNDIDEFLKLTWDCSQDDMSKWIGINEAGLFTMTNSAYLNGSNTLMTATTLNPANTYPTLADYLKDPKPCAVIPVERMVAKFSAPTSDIEVIGSDRFYRPNQDALGLVVYDWNGEIYNSTKKNWRIHLLGWTINGEETQNYIFKNIPSTANAYSNWSDWNQPDKKRSYWSIDPNYYDNTNDFYPWQVRKAADWDEVISITTGKLSNRTPALRYYKFDDVKWNDSIYVHENTFDPSGRWYDHYLNSQNTTYNPSYLDGRPSILAGPHILVTAEIYLEQEGGSYIGQFEKVKDLYSDRVKRFYLTEKDWFKMFVKDFNNALLAQEQMGFEVYDWDKDNQKDNNHYITYPTGSCKLYYNDRELTFDEIERMYPTEDTKLFTSSLANVRNGDGSLIPWLSGLSVKNPNGGNLEYSTDGGRTKKTEWNEDMYMSLFYEWFGPISHYDGGKMYYSGDIKHKGVTSGYNFYGTVRNHWYTFQIKAINSLGIPIDDPTQLIIPQQQSYQDQIGVYIELLGWHPGGNTTVEF